MTLTGRLPPFTATSPHSRATCALQAPESRISEGRGNVGLQRGCISVASESWILARNPGAVGRQVKGDGLRSPLRFDGSTASSNEPAIRARRSLGGVCASHFCQCAANTSPLRSPPGAPLLPSLLGASSTHAPRRGATLQNPFDSVVRRDGARFFQNHVVCATFVNAHGRC